MFTQLFTVLGIVRRHQNVVALPFVYALLTSKATYQYATVLHAITSAAEELHIAGCEPRRIMTDFEQAIINACSETFENCCVSCCFFHLGQSMYRKIQATGLQQAYQDADNEQVRTQAHMILALAFVPVADVPSVFRKLSESAIPDLLPVMKYFEETYIGIKAQGRRAAKPPTYPVELWNQREAALAGEHKTNNVSEGWHNRFRLLVGKNHPDLFSLLQEIQKEQADTEIAVTEMYLGRKVRVAPKKKWVDFQNRIQNITNDYDTYKRERNELQFLELVGSNIVL